MSDFNFTTRKSRDVLMVNDPRMMEPVSCRALRAFYVGRKIVAIGEYCALPLGEAEELAAIKKLKIL
jgi:hypothetical protein